VFTFLCLVLQCEPVSVIHEQQVLLAEKTRLVSELELANTNASAMISEIEQLRSAATAEAAKLVAAKEALAVSDAEKVLHSSDLAAAKEELAESDAEKLQLSSDLAAAKEALDASDAEKVRQSSERTAMASEIRRLQSSVNYGENELESMKADVTMKVSINNGLSAKNAMLLYECENLRRIVETRRIIAEPPSSSSSPASPELYTFILSAVQFAETACDEKKGEEAGEDWSATELRNRVIGIVQKMVPYVKRAELDRKVFEVSVVRCDFLFFSALTILLPDLYSSLQPVLQVDRAPSYAHVP
jgi:hypothetical protein